jgi:2-oxoglutarate ferredoxin oxidoreductase subunit alpha
MGEKLLMKGNEAIGEAAIRAGCRYYFGYPITPQSELTAYMAKGVYSLDKLIIFKLPKEEDTVIII